MAVEGVVPVLSDGNVTESSTATTQRQHLQEHSQVENTFQNAGFNGQDWRIISERRQMFQQH